MSLLLHCIGHAAALASAPEGELCCIVEGELAVLAAPLEGRQSLVAPKDADLLQYQRRIQRLHAAADVLPMRFGSLLENPDAVRAHLRERHRDYLGALARVAGCAELGLRALVRAPSPPPEVPDAKALPRCEGTEYLKARGRRHAWERALVVSCAALERSLLAIAAPHYKEHRAEAPRLRPEGALVSLHFLAPRAGVPALREALSPLVPSEAGGSLTGPWAPYNFV